MPSALPWCGPRPAPGRGLLDAFDLDAGQVREETIETLLIT
jgi:hypothetical protein